MFLALALAAAAAPSPPQRRVEARATVRIVRPVAVTSDNWDRAAPQRRRERIERNQGSTPILLRFVEFE